MSVRRREMDPERESWTTAIQRHLRPQRVAQLWRPLDEGAGQFLQIEIIQQEIRAWHGETFLNENFYLVFGFPHILPTIQLV